MSGIEEVNERDGEGVEEVSGKGRCGGEVSEWDGEGWKK